MFDPAQAPEPETSSGKGPARILYAACGLVYRSGCGPSEHVLALAREIGLSPGVDLTVLFAHAFDPPPSGPYRIETLKDPGLTAPSDLETDSLVLGTSPFNYFSHKRRVRSYASGARGRFDVVVERMWGYGGILARSLRRSGCLVVLEENGPISWRGALRSPGDWIRFIYLLLARHRLKKIYRLGRATIVQTSNLARRLMREFKVPEERLVIIPNGVDLARFLALPARKDEHRTSPLTLVYTGTLDSNHDLKPLCRAALQRPGRIELRILGSGPGRRELDDLIRESEAENIRLFGRIPHGDVVKQIEKADLCVAAYSAKPHERSGFQFSPLKLLEYAAAGRPVVMAGAGPNADAAASDANAFFIPNETQSWIDLIDSLPERAELSRMGQRGRPLVEERGWDRVAHKYLDLIESLHGRIVLAPLPFSNPENRYIDRLHTALSKAGVEILDPGFLSLRWLLRHARKIDVIHLHWPESHFQFKNSLYSLLKWMYLMFRLRTAKGLGCALAWTVHNLEAHDKSMSRLDRWTRKYLLNRAGSILLGESAMPAIRERFGPHVPVRRAIIRHGHYLGSYGEVRDKKESRVALDLPASLRIYLFLGTLRPYKGVVKLVRVFSQGPFSEALLVVAGKMVDADAALETKKWITARPERFQYLPGFVPDEKMATLLGAADFMVLPYEEVHMSGTLILALSYGLPIIAPDRGLIRDYLPEEAGIIYDPADPDGLEGALTESLEKDARAMGRRGRERASTLDWEKIAEEHVKFYSALITHRRRRPMLEKP